MLMFVFVKIHIKAKSPTCTTTPSQYLLKRKGLLDFQAFFYSCTYNIF